MINKKQSYFLIGIDDTDNADSRGTGFHARQLGHMLEKEGIGQVGGITRHQLFVDPAIPYTSQNSSACLQVAGMNMEVIIRACSEYLASNSAPGSDAGLCACNALDVSPAMLSWGIAAKDRVLTMQDAFRLAEAGQFFLKGFTGTHVGIIGALAAVGLFAGGNDGRYIWRKGIRELREISTGLFTAGKLAEELDLDEITSLDGEHPKKNDKILTSEWVRPVRKGHKAVLITQRTTNNDEYEWEITGKEIIRTIS